MFFLELKLSQIKLIWNKDKLFYIYHYELGDLK